MKKAVLILIVISLVFGVTACGAYGYFDTTKSLSDMGINIGEWREKSVVGDLMEYINKSDTYVPLEEGTEVRFLDEIASFLWDERSYDENGDIKEGTLKEQYKGHTPEQLKDIIDSAITYVKNYLDVDENGEVYYPHNTASVDAVSLNYNTPLAAGQSVQVASAILTADLESSPWGSWEPMTYYISMEAPNGEDISDYALEVLYSPPYNATDVFKYGFRFSDPSSWNANGFSRALEREDVALYPVTGQRFLTEVYRNNGSGTYISKYYRHTLVVPPAKEYVNADGETVTSIWSRFAGVNMVIGAPSGSPSGSQQQFVQGQPAHREGMILMGKPNGKTTELRISIHSRNPIYESIGIVPLLLNISRGVELDANGQPVNAGQTTDVFPIIKVKATRGYAL